MTRAASPEIVFATCLVQPDFQPGDRLVAEALERLGARVRPTPWNGGFDAFSRADMVVVRSTWDYWDHAATFVRWLVALDGAACVVNSPSLMRWNLDKRYLLALAAGGAPITPTLAVENCAGAIMAALDALGLSRAVVKPVIGATASGLSIIERSDSTGIERAAAALTGPGLVQAVIPEIRAGETSFVFIEGTFSHAVLKIPAEGDIRCQVEHGGRTVNCLPSAAAVDQAREILEMLPERPLYARVDAIVLDDRLIVMEVEVIEPELFVVHAPAAADRFASALMRRLD
ncbi:MAG: hypothetical protein KDA46_07055 [Parvularculaceae bacterium]|nr:hypothetical protein [Parvularculaceae bacterium]